MKNLKLSFQVAYAILVTKATFYFRVTKYLNNQSGSETENSLPSPSADVTSNFPPCAFTIS